MLLLLLLLCCCCYCCCCCVVIVAALLLRLLCVSLFVFSVSTSHFSLSLSLSLILFPCLPAPPPPHHPSPLSLANLKDISSFTYQANIQRAVQARCSKFVFVFSEVSATSISATEFDIAANQVETVDLTGTGFLPGGTYCMSEGLSVF